jgi:Protein of unknown function (DUF3140)
MEEVAMASRRVEPDVERLWQEFHDYVNVTSPQLRTWLLTESANEDGALADEAGPAVEGTGGRILAVLAKRKVDLTDDDVEIMEGVVNEIRDLLDHRPPGGAADDSWRRALLDLGHDPLREPPGAE